MKKALLFLLFVGFSTVVRAQQTPPPDQVVVVNDSLAVFTAVEQEPTFPGGMQKFSDYIKANLKYPDEARRNSVQGRVFLTCIIEKDGSVSNVKVVRGIGNGCDEEAWRLLKNSPKWSPGMQNGRTVRAYYTIPISFRL